MKNNVEELKRELIELYEDLAALEAQYESNRINSEGKSDIWTDIKYTKEQITKLELELDENTVKKSR